MDGSPNPEFIRKNNLKPIFHPVEFVEAIFTVYKKKLGTKRNLLFSLLNNFWSGIIKKRLIWVWDDTCHPNFVPFTMDEFECHLYLYYCNSLKPSPRIQMNFKSSSADPVQGNKFLHKILVTMLWGNTSILRAALSARIYGGQYWHKSCIQIVNCTPFLNHISYVFHFSCLLGCALYVDEKTIGFQGRHMDKMRTYHKNKGGGFQEDALCNQGYTYVFFLRNEFPPKEYTSVGLPPLNACVFLYF